MLLFVLIGLLWARTPAHYVVDSSGHVLSAYNEHVKIHPASLTKKMTLYIIFETLRSGKIGLNTLFKTSTKASKQMPSKLGLRPKEKICVRDAIMALITKSANDVAVVVAENISGSVEHFVSRMNLTAKRLGMHRTCFYNPSGVPDARQVTTAFDMATLGRALHVHFRDQYARFKETKFLYKRRFYHNHNKLLGRIQGLDGIKTGYVNASGFNISTSVTRNGKRIFAVIIGGASAKARDQYAAKLIEAAFKKKVTLDHVMSRLT